jgi:hypothetical protein
MLTPDRRYLIVGGRLWRATNPSLPERRRRTLTEQLMAARRAVQRALRADDVNALTTARRAVDRAKVALGERGPVWWKDGADDFHRRLVRNTPYARWYARASARSGARQTG